MEGIGSVGVHVQRLLLKALIIRTLGGEGRGSASESIWSNIFMNRLARSKVLLMVAESWNLSG